MTRGIWKGPFVHPSLLKKVDKIKRIQTKNMPIKTWSRNSTIIPEFVGHSFLIHNGKNFIPITISEEMVGHKLGEFSPTRKFSGHTQLQIKKQQQKEQLVVQHQKQHQEQHQKQHQEQHQKQHQQHQKQHHQQHTKKDKK